MGATTQQGAQISSPGGNIVTGAPTMKDMPQRAGVLQLYIDSLTARGRGVNKIIVATHLQQFALEQAFAGLLNDVDIFFGRWV